MPSQAEILNALFSAASGLSSGTGWPQFLGLLGDETRASAVTLQIDRQGRPEQGWHWMQSGGAAHLSISDRHRMRSHRVYSQNDLPGYASAPGPLRAIKCPFGPQAGDHALVTLQRQGDDFRAIDGVQLSSLVPYLAPALTQWEALSLERQRARLSQSLMRDLGAGWVMFSPHAQLIDMDPDLRDPLAEIGGIRFAPDGRPSFRDEATAQALRQGLSAALAGMVPAPLRLSDAPLMDMVLSAEPQDPQGQPLLMGRVRSARAAQDLPLPQIARHFGLSPSEARLACLLCDGLTLAEAADQLGWTVQTARSASKQLFARMEVRGQTGVIRRMQTSAVWLTSDPA